MTKEQYQEYLKSSHWQEFRQTVLAVTNRCAACDSKKRINVHHRHYRCLHQETLNDVVVLCRACHGYLHQDMLKGMTQEAWLRLHCPKLYSGVVLKKVDPQKVERMTREIISNRRKHRKSKKRSRAETTKWGRASSKKIQAKHSPVKVNSFMVKVKTKGKKPRGLKLNQTMDLAEWKATHPNAK